MVDFASEESRSPGIPSGGVPDGGVGGDWARDGLAHAPTGGGDPMGGAWVEVADIGRVLRGRPAGFVAPTDLAATGLERADLSEAEMNPTAGGSGAGGHGRARVPVGGGGSGGAVGWRGAP